MMLFYQEYQTKPQNKGNLNHQEHQVHQEQRKPRMFKRHRKSIFVFAFLVILVPLVVQIVLAFDFF
jgi:hypothetical protein